MHNPGREVDLQFSQPFKQILTMVVIIGLVGAGGYLAYPALGPVFLTSIYLNGFIAIVFVIGVLACFGQVFALISSVSWIEGFAIDRPGHEFVKAPRLLKSLATLLASRGARMQIGASSARSILDSIATRLDEAREITRYIINLLIFLGLLGTFFGLATTVPAVVETIKSLAPADGETGNEVFGRLMVGLEKQMGGMGTAFGSSLLGLAGSLVVGLLDLFAGHGQGRFYRELEEWLSTITRVGFSTGDGESDGFAADGGNSDDVIQYLADSLNSLHRSLAENLGSLQEQLTKSDIDRSMTDDKIGAMTDAVIQMTKKMNQVQKQQNTAAPVSNEEEVRILGEQAQSLAKIANGQNKIANGQNRVVEAQEKLVEALSNQVEEGQTDAESRMRLRSIDVQLLRILEEMSAGRQDTVAELRADMASLNKSIRTLNRKPPQQPQPAPRRGKA